MPEFKFTDKELEVFYDDGDSIEFGYQVRASGSPPRPVGHCLFFACVSRAGMKRNGGGLRTVLRWPLFFLRAGVALPTKRGAHWWI